MALNVLYLLSSIVTARLLEKKKMRVASVAYSVMFVIMLVVLLFTADVDVIRGMMVHLVGKTHYVNVHFAFMDAIHAPLYSVLIVGAIILTIVVQLAATIFCTAKAIAHYLFKKNSFSHKAPKACDRFVRSMCGLRLPQDVNLLYCRMLN